MKNHLFRKKLYDLLTEPDVSHGVARIQKKTKPLLEKQKIILFGAGALGRFVAHQLTIGGKRPIAFCDNNPSLWKREIDGFPVLSPDDAIALYRETGIFIATIYTSNPLLEQLAACNVCFISFPELTWCYPDLFLPYCALDLPHKIIEESEAVQECLEIWSDIQSQEEYIGQIQWRFTLNRDFLPLHAPAQETYFAPDLFDLHDQEVMVDCGAYTGDSIKDFLKCTNKSFEKIVAIEADSQNKKQLEEFLNTFNSSQIKIVNKAIGSKNATIKFNALGSVSSTAGDGELDVECVTLDEVLKNEKPTYIKMDIEGSELEALKGAKETISQHYPILAICLYHRPYDLWQIPKYIQAIAPDYKFFLRRYSDECWEQVCYAVPTERSKK